ncbi:MAG: hypothetical protein A2Z04_05495, partial [Chloroflexi bacterium RBG_16_57_9]
MILPSILTERQTELWRAEKRQIEHLLTLLAGWEAQPEDLTILRRALAQLDELFLLVIVGEFNSGKSSLINALLGEAFLAEGVTPTTDRIYVLKHGEKSAAHPIEPGVWAITHPAQFLAEINIVDTPGTNAVLRQHEAIVRDFVPRSDLVVFVTSADRPFTESERAFLDAIRAWGKKVVIVINKVDILSTAEDVRTVTDFVARNAQQLLEITPEIFPLSARRALQTSSDGAESKPSGDGFGAFENYILETLNQESRIRLKLLNPLGVSEKITREYTSRVVSRLGLLGEDLETLESIDRQLGIYREDMGAEFERRFAKIDNIILEMRLRGEQFFDETLRLRRLLDLMNSRRLHQDYEQIVVADAPEQIERQVQDIIDWMVEQELRQWRTTSKELGRRQRTEFLHTAADEAAGGFEYNRRTLLETIGRAAQDVVAHFDRSAEARKLVEGVQDSLTQTMLVEVGAVSLGVILHALLATAAADATGILAASIVGAMGFAILPYKKHKAKEDLRTKTEKLRERLRQVLGG